MRIVLSILAIGLMSSIHAQETKVWTLKECVDYALENNISIKQSQLDKLSAKEDLRVAKWNLAPNLNANATQNYNFGSSIGVSGTRTQANFRSNNFSLNSQVVLFDGFANICTIKQSKIAYEAQDESIAKMRNDISLNVVNAYLQILFAQEQLKVAQSQIEVSREQVSRLTELVDAGVLPEGDLLNVKSTLAADNQSLIVAENSLIFSKLQLAQLLQLESPVIEVANVEVSVDNQTILGNSSDEIYAKASTSFPEIKLAEKNIEIANKGVKIARANFYPTLSMSFGLNTAYQHLQGTTDFSPFRFSDQIDDNFGKSLVVNLSIPIFNRYQFRSGVNKAKINYQRMEYNLESEKLRLQQTIQTAYNDAQASSKSFDAATISVEAQTKAFDYAQERFKAGAINSFDFNQSKNNLLNAQSQLIQSKYDFMFKLKVLEFYFGVPFIAN